MSVHRGGRGPGHMARRLGAAGDGVILSTPLTMTFLGPNLQLDINAALGTDLATASVDHGINAFTVSTQGTAPTFTTTAGPGGGKGLVFTSAGNLKYSKAGLATGVPNDVPLACLFRATSNNVGGGAKVIACTASTNIMNTSTNFMGTFGNSAFINSSKSVLNGEDHLFMLDASTSFAAGFFRDNGTKFEAYASSGNYAETTVGGNTSAGQLATCNIQRVISGSTQWAQALADNAAIFNYHIVEGIIMWEAGLQALLPGGHPYALDRPRASLVANRVTIGGDSYAVAINTDFALLYANNHPSISVIQRAVAGTWTNDWIFTKFDTVIADRPKALVLQLGTNMFPSNLGNMPVAATAAAALISLWNYYQDALPGLDLFFPTILPVDETRATTSTGISYSGFNTWRAAVNTTIRAQDGTTRNGGRRICYDFAADATIGIDSAALGALWNADGIHPEYTTHSTYMYPIFNAAMVAAGYN